MDINTKHRVAMSQIKDLKLHDVFIFSPSRLILDACLADLMLNIDRKRVVYFNRESKYDLDEFSSFYKKSVERMDKLQENYRNCIQKYDETCIKEYDTWKNKILNTDLKLGMFNKTISDFEQTQMDKKQNYVKELDMKCYEDLHYLVLDNVNPKLFQLKDTRVVINYARRLNTSVISTHTKASNLPRKIVPRVVFLFGNLNDKELYVCYRRFGCFYKTYQEFKKTYDAITFVDLQAMVVNTINKTTSTYMIKKK